MKIGYLLVPAILFAALTACAQDWQDCKPDGSYSFKEVKDSVRRVTTTHGYWGSDVKAFNRSGDLASVAILQMLNDREIGSPQTLQDVLVIIREDFACTSRCIAAPSDRQPRVALLLLESLHNKTRGKMRSDVDETRQFLLQQERGGQ